MKAYKLLTLFAAASVMLACDPQKLDISRAYPEGSIVPPVVKSMSKVVVSQANYDENGLVTFAWDAADFGFQGALDYAVYLSGEDRQDICLASNINKTSYSIDYQSLYNRLTGESHLGLSKGAVHTVSCYVTATTGSDFSVVKSDPVRVEFDIARISTGINMIYVSGDFNSNHPDRNGIEETAAGGKAYQGLVLMKNAAVSSNQVRFLEYTYAGTTEGDAYGDDGTGKLVKGGSPVAADAELSYVKVDLAAGTYSIKPLDGPVRLCGFNGSWRFSSNPELVYDPEQNAWTGTADYTGGTFRMSINDSWGFTFGPKDINSLTVKDGSDIKIYHNDISKPLIGGDANFGIDAPGKYTFRFYYESADCTWHLAVNLAK